MIFSDDRDKLIGILNSTISLLNNLDYDDQDCYSLDDIKQDCYDNLNTLDDYLMTMYISYIYCALEYKQNLRQAC